MTAALARDGLASTSAPTVTSEPRATSASRSRTLRTLRRDRGGRTRLERHLTWWIALVGYAGLGWEMVVTRGLIPGDALARTANASAVVLSRDPHLEAIGFVWPPFPSLWQVLVVPLGRIWPPLVTHGYAGVLVSAALMALAVCTVSAWLADLGVGPWPRRAVTLLFALHPFVLAYGSNGMSEAGMLCFLLIAARRLALWFENRRPIDLAVASAALGLAYLTRYEVAGAIAVVGVALAVDGLRRSRGRTHRMQRVGLELVVGLLPASFAVGLWAFLSWAVVDEPFAQFSSRYGNSLAAGSLLDRSIGSASQLDAARSGIAGAAGSLSGLPRVGFFLQQVLAFGGLAACVLLVWLAWWGTKGGPRVAVALLVLGGPLAFQLASSLRGATFAWGRFAIAIVPVAALLAGVVLANATTSGARRVAPVVVVVVLAASVVLAGAVVRDGALQTGDERSQLSMVRGIGTWEYDTAPSLTDAGTTVARDLERLDLRPGDVLTDSASAFPVIVASEDQRVFVIPADRDFERILADPAPFGVRYLLAVDPESSGFDALYDSRSSLFADGAGIAHQVADWPLGEGLPHFRLYELDEQFDR